MLRHSLVSFILKVGLSLSLLYGALFCFLKPLDAVSFFPSLLTHSTDDRAIIYICGILSLALIAWIFSGTKKFASSFTTTIVLGLVGLINITNISFLFKLGPSFMIALALVLRYYPRIRVISKTKTPGSNKKVSIFTAINESDTEAEENEHTDDMEDDEMPPTLDRTREQRDTI